MLCCHCIIESWDKLYFCFFMVLLSYLLNLQQEWGEGNTSWISESWNHVKIVMLLRAQWFGVLLCSPAHIIPEGNRFVWIDTMVLNLRGILLHLLFFSYFAQQIMIFSLTDYPKSFCWIHSKHWSSKCGIKQVGFVAWYREERGFSASLSVGDLYLIQVK